MSNILLVTATHLEHHDTHIDGIPIHNIGVGKVESALNMKNLIELHKLQNGGGKPSHVINFGSCGNLKDHKVGDVLEVKAVWDDFFTGNTGIPSHPAIKLADEGVHLFTTDLFYNSNLTHHMSSKYYLDRCDIVDMEGYSVAKVCEKARISVSLFKWVSDDGDHHDWKENAAIGYKHFKQIFHERFSYKMA